MALAERSAVALRLLPQAHLGAIPQVLVLEILQKMEDTATPPAISASTLTAPATAVGGSAAGAPVAPPAVRADQEPLPSGGATTVPLRSGEPAVPARTPSTETELPLPSPKPLPDASGSAGAATGSNVLAPTGGPARATPMEAVVGAVTPPSVASAPTAASSAAAATQARGADMLAEAVARGVSPMREELQRVTTTLNELVREVHHLCMGHETLARGHERVVMSMTMMRGDCTKAFECITANLKDLRISMNVGSTNMDDVYTKISEIKRRTRAKLVERTGLATVRGNVCHSTTRSWLEYVRITSNVLGKDDSDASDWLLGYADLPTRKGSSAVKSMCHCTLIHRVNAHAVYQWKEVVTAAYFAAMGLSRDNIPSQVAHQLLSNMGYLTSVRGFPAILCGAEALLLLLGAVERVEQPASAGDRKTINRTLGHIALVTAFVRVVLEVAANLRPARGGVGEGGHDVWVEDLPRVHAELPCDADALDGLRLLDGADSCRAQLPDDAGDEPAGREGCDVPAGEEGGADGGVGAGEEGVL
ncbi:hypothetical protein I4F81_008562 [Pyropia yezoensis]|uniref:Uncharacterized protein n=1 Tax=Pyropia yezoensis TaxID=2788 RepID=A0ACC3C786_PYRYE|nr:hypothetical protein I4F81_008562 [Neopyropia yezoensis]